MNKLKQKSLENLYTNKLLEILGSSKVQSIETDISKEYDITEIEKYIEIRRITIYIKRNFRRYRLSYYYHGALIIPLREPVEICGEIQVPKILYKVDNIFILVLNKLIESWLLREQRQFVPEFKKVLDYMTGLAKHLIIQKWKEGDNKQRLEKYVYLFPENKLDS